MDGTIELKDQLRDYKFRGEELTTMNFLDFMLDTYEDSKHCRIRRSQGHETLSRFIGKLFCRSDNDHDRDLFRGSMLMLLKPWRNLHQLKGPTETFETAFDNFISQADEKAHRVQHWHVLFPTRN